MDGGAAGTDGEAAGPGGGMRVTSGDRGLVVALLFGLLIVFALLQLYANVGSILADAARDERVVTAWQVWGTETTSLIGWLIVVALIWKALPHVLPPARSWPVAIGLLLVGAVAASLAHVAIMVALREVLWASRGLDYDFASGWDGWPYEFRKDVADYPMFVAILSAARWFLDRPSPAAFGEHPVAPRRFTAVDGARRVELPFAEIDRIEAAGNYVEIHAGTRKVLHRATMQAIEDQLGEGQFARIHRSRIVRRDAVREVTTLASGDFEVTLADDTIHRGSRRYRDRLD